MNCKKFYVAKCYKHSSPVWLEGFDDRGCAEAYLLAMRGEHPNNTYVLFERVADKPNSQVINISVTERL